MDIDEMKDRISMALKDPILQQGFEIICKNLSEFEKENAELKEKYDTCLRENTGLKIHSAYVEKKLTEAKKYIGFLLGVVHIKNTYNKEIEEEIAKAEAFINKE